MKLAYVGLDVLDDALKTLLQLPSVEIIQIYSSDADNLTEFNREVLALGKEHGIPAKIRRLSRQDLEALADRGCEVLFVAGYEYRLPVCDRLRMVNLHPSLLPIGRGAWPMPGVILKGLRESGITLHRIAKNFDEGAILLQKKIAVDDRENLQTLNRKLIDRIPEAVRELFADFDGFYANALPQTAGEYWPCPREKDWTVYAGMPEEEADRICRAFYGETCRYLTPDYTYDIIHGVIDEESEEETFRPLELEDREALVRLHQTYPSQLSESTFAMLFCWKNLLQLSVHVEEELFCIRMGDNTYMYPIGHPEAVASFLCMLQRTKPEAVIRYCDRKQLDSMLALFGQEALVIEEASDDCDYKICTEELEGLGGSSRMRVRNDLHHFEKVTPDLTVKRIDKEDLRSVLALSEECPAADLEAVRTALEHYEDLQLKGVLVRSAGRPIGYAICSEMDDHTLQGHFSRCILRERGGGIYVMRACALEYASEYSVTNLEDDMGEEGLRRFKHALHAEVIPAWRVRFRTDGEALS